MKKIVGFFRLMRPANIVTAVSDILAGIAISGFFLDFHDGYTSVVLLIFSTMALYGGGVVMNDVFDAQLDAVERPERPIPSGLIKKSEAALLGVVLLLAGVCLASTVSYIPGILALAIAIAAVVYDKWSKHHPVVGPLNMGLCRGFNLLLGMSIIPSQAGAHWYLACVPVIYIGAITMISRGEVHGGKPITMYAAAALYLIAMASILYVATTRDQTTFALIFILVWAFMVFIPLKNAARTPEGRFIGRAVKAGVLALILMNAAWAAAFGVPFLAIIIVLLLPVSLLLAKAFAVT